MLLVPIFQPEEFNGKLYTEYGYVLKQFAKYMAEIERLQAKLEEKTDSETDKLVKLPFDALETANMLINATYSRKANGIDRLRGREEDTIETDMYSVNDLEQIAEHLLVYCKHNREVE